MKSPLASDLTGIAVVLVLAVGGFILFPDNLAFLAGMMAVILLVVSLDLVSGVCGVASLGQAALFGAGAYGAGIAAANGLGDPLLLLGDEHAEP